MKTFTAIFLTIIPFISHAEPSMNNKYHPGYVVVQVREKYVAMESNHDRMSRLSSKFCAARIKRENEKCEADEQCKKKKELDMEEGILASPMCGGFVFDRADEIKYPSVRYRDTYVIAVNSKFQILATSVNLGESFIPVQLIQRIMFKDAAFDFVNSSKVPDGSHIAYDSWMPVELSDTGEPKEYEK